MKIRVNWDNHSFPFAGRCYLAGGALRKAIDPNEIIQDYDLFFKDPEYVPVIEEWCKEREFNVVFRCPEGKLITLKDKNKENPRPKIQLITETYYDSMEFLIDSFDIKACRFAYDGDQFLAPYSSIRDVLKKQITLHRLTYPNASFRRILKYTEKGYKVPFETIDWYNRTISEMIEVDGMWRRYID